MPSSNFQDFPNNANVCDFADNVELCKRVFLSGWGLFVGSIVGACVFHWLTTKVPFMHGWWERASTPMSVLVIASLVISVVLWVAAENV